MPSERHRDKYPCRLRDVREAKMLTREQLSSLTARIAEADPVLYRFVTYETLRNLEAGFVRPRLTTARTLSEVLGLPADEIFPEGIDSGARHHL